MILLFGGIGLVSFLSFSLDVGSNNLNVPNIISSGAVLWIIIVFIYKSGNSLTKITRVQLLLFVSFVCWFTAEVLFGYYNGILDVDAYPSTADIFYTAGYIFFIFLLCTLNRTYKIELTIIVSAIVTFALFAFYVLYLSVFIFEVYKFTGNSIDLLLTFSYPILDLFIIVGSIVYYIREKEISLNKEYLSWLFIAACGLSFFIADVIFGFKDLFDLSTTSNTADLFFNWGYLLLGAGLITRSIFIRQANINTTLDH